MPLAAVLTFGSTPEQFAEWQFLHEQDHYEIIDGIGLAQNIFLTPYPLDPFDPQNPGVWLSYHQQTHNDMNGALGLPGADLESLDFRDPQAVAVWSFQDFLEHAAARQTLGI